MRTIFRTSVAALLATGTALIGATALASSHREAPAIGNDPVADNTDLYAWVQGTNLVILANYIPLEEPAGGPNFNAFADDVLYEVHIVRGGTSLDDAITYQIKFNTTLPAYNDPAVPDPTPATGQEFFSQIAGAVQTYSVTKVVAGQAPVVLVAAAPVAPPNIGPRTNALAYATGGASYEAFFIGGGGNVITSLGASEGRVFAGPRDDGFYVDLGGVFDLAGLRVLSSVPDGPAGNPVPGIDNVAGYNTHAIALEIPLTVANGGPVVTGTPDTDQTVGVWASASRRKVTVLRTAKGPDSYGPWVQVSRLGLPLINEAVIGLQDKDFWNRVTPVDELTYFAPYFLNPVIVRNAEFAGFYGAGPDGVLAGCPPIEELEAGRTDIIDVINLTDIPTTDAHAIATVGDVLRVDLGIPSGFPNGRPLVPGTNREQADVTDVLLDMLLCKFQAGPALSQATGLQIAGIPDGANSNDKVFRADFPYLAVPHEGFSEGHGELTDPHVPN